MHYFPSNKTVQQKWIQFKCIHRRDFVPKKLSTLCSAHFDESCFEHKPVVTRTNDGKGKVIEFIKQLIKGSIPSRYTTNLQTLKRINIHDKTTLVSHFFVFCGFINEKNILFNYRKVVHHMSYAQKIYLVLFRTYLVSGEQSPAASVQLPSSFFNGSRQSHERNVGNS